jgi:hypothetical protein
MDENVIAEYGTHRVRLAYEESPHKPYNDGGAPIWRVEPSRNYTDRVDARHEEGLSTYEPDGRIAEAIDQFWSAGAPGFDTLERYLRIFHGATAFERWHSGSSWYFTCDPADWRTKMGITDETMQREGYGDGLMDEWKAWCNGEVYGVITEQQARKVTTITERGTHEVLETLADDDHWFEVDALWGHYGYDWAKEAALNALCDVEPEILATCPDCPWAEVIVEDNARWDAQFKHAVEVHQWRTHKWRYGPNNEFSSAVCRRSGCNVMGTGDWYNDGECEGTD